MAAVWWDKNRLLSSFLNGFLASTASLNATHLQVPHGCSSGPLNTLLPAGRLRTSRAGLELAFLWKVTPPVWLQCLGNPKLWFPQCLWLSSEAVLKQNYLSNNFKCFASTYEVSLPMSWEAKYYMIGKPRQRESSVEVYYEPCLAALEDMVTSQKSIAKSP